MHYNNRMPVYREKKLPKEKFKHTEVKDGKVIFVEGLRPSPYTDVPCESLKLKSRIETGTFENHEGSPRHLEKAQGSDIMTEELRKQEQRYQENKREVELKNERKKLRKVVEQYNPAAADLIKD